ITQTYSNISNFTLLAVPFFILLGRLLNEGLLTEKMVAFADTVVGHIRGALGHINILVSMMFASLSGSSQADTASIGSVMIPAMIKAGYNPGYSVAITAASSIMGGVIPPSILMVIYGSFGQVSIGALFLAGIVPGVLIGLSQMLYTYRLAVKEGYGANPRQSFTAMGKAGLATSPALLIPILILGGISGGFFSATEAASIGAIYALFLGVIGYRNIKLRKLPRLLGEAVIDFSIPLFAIASAGIFGWLIAYLKAPQIIEGFILGFTDNYYIIFSLIMLFLLMIGTFMSGLTAMIIFLPVIQHLGDVGGVDPVLLGLSVNLALGCGLLTPPYGICILIAAQIGNVPSNQAFLAVLPLVGFIILLMLVGMVFPDLYLFLPKLFMPEVFQ
ncbi:MAG: TRAP transporter large permease, partial [Pseudomonadota bacterium]